MHYSCRVPVLVLLLLALGVLVKATQLPSNQPMHIDNSEYDEDGIPKSFLATLNPHSGVEENDEMRFTEQRQDGQPVDRNANSDMLVDGQTLAQIVAASQAAEEQNMQNDDMEALPVEAASASSSASAESQNNNNNNNNNNNEAPAASGAPASSSSGSDIVITTTTTVTTTSGAEQSSGSAQSAAQQASAQKVRTTAPQHTNVEYAQDLSDAASHHTASGAPAASSASSSASAASASASASAAPASASSASGSASASSPSSASVSASQEVAAAGAPAAESVSEQEHEHEHEHEQAEQVEHAEPAAEPAAEAVPPKTVDRSAFNTAEPDIWRFREILSATPAPITPISAPPATTTTATTRTTAPTTTATTRTTAPTTTTTTTTAPTTPAPASPVTSTSNSTFSYLCGCSSQVPVGAASKLPSTCNCQPFTSGGAPAPLKPTGPATYACECVHTVTTYANGTKVTQLSNCKCKTRGPQGPEGPKGPTGDQGPKGDAGNNATFPLDYERQMKELELQVEGIIQASKVSPQRQNLVLDATSPEWARSTDACPDFWTRESFNTEEQRVYCSPPTNATLYGPFNAKCILLAKFPEIFDRCGWSMMCKAPWKRYGCYNTESDTPANPVTSLAMNQVTNVLPAPPTDALLKMAQMVANELGQNGAGSSAPSAINTADAKKLRDDIIARIMPATPQAPPAAPAQKL